MASIMVSAVAYVVTFETPPETAGGSRPQLDRMAREALAILRDTPVQSSFGSDALSAYLAECLQGNCTHLTQKLDKLLPEGTAYVVYVSNGHETFPVYLEKEPTGETVTATLGLEPKWSHSFVATARNNVNPATDPLAVYTLPVFNGNVVSQGGSPLLVLVKGTRLSDGSNYTLTTFASTQAAAAEDESLVPAVSLSFLVPQRDAVTGAVQAWVPGGVGNWYPDVVDQVSGNPTRTNATFKLWVNETADVTVPAGTQVTIRLPRGWTGSADQAANAAHWKVLENATDSSSAYVGSDIRAELLHDLRDEGAEFEFDAVYHGDVLNYYPFHAALSRGALAEARLLVAADDWPAETQTFRAPAARLSYPRPMGAVANTTWTLSFDIPNTVGSNANLANGNVKGLASAVIVHEIVILEQDGNAIFGSQVGGLAHAHNTTVFNGSIGEWESQGERLVWRGELRSTDGPHSLTFYVHASGVPGDQGSRHPIVPPVSFDSYKGRIVPRHAPGMFRDTYLPANSSGPYGQSLAGYDSTGVSATVRSDAVYRGTQLPGSHDYNLTGLTSSLDSLYGSYVSVERRSVPLGGQVVMTVDVQSMLFALAEAGQTAGVKVRFYPPWAGDERAAKYEQNNLDTGLLGGKLSQVVVLDVNQDGYPDPIIGTTDGRVLALDALTGARLEGNAFVAPLGSDASTTASAASITHLALADIGGQTYIVVGTDEQSGIHVLNRTLSRIWTWDKSPLTTIAVDASADVDGDGRNDVLVALREPQDATNTYALYVLRALEGQTTLQPHLPAAATPIADAFFVGTGEPSALMGMDELGPSLGKGVAVSLRTLPGQKTQTQLTHGDPTQALAPAEIVIETPRHGLVGLDAEGREVFTFFGSPVSAVRRFANPGDVATDLVGGSPSGYVYEMDGRMAAQPAYPIIPVGYLAIKDADTRDPLHSAFLTADGGVEFTTTGWNTRRCVSCLMDLTVLYPDANGIAANGTSSIWLVGNLNGMWRTDPAPSDPAFPEMQALTALNFAATKHDGVAIAPYSFATNAHTFYDVDFGWGAESGDTGWVVGGPCDVPLVCDESVVMRTDAADVLPIPWHLASHAEGTLLAADGGKVSRPLTRINFTTDQVGWIAGHAGTLLRTTDGGTSWRGVSVPTTVNLKDVSCAPLTPSHCIVVGDAGVALRTTNATSAYPGWTNISANLGDGILSRQLLSVGVASDKVAYVGAHNMLLKTYDGGDSWTTIPMNYLESDVNRITVFPDDTGFAFGGNAGNARLFHLHDFLTQSKAQTLPLGSIPAGSKIRSASVTGEYTNTTGATVQLNASRDGGATWTPMGWAGSSMVIKADNGVPYAVTEHRWDINYAEGQGDDFRVRVDFATSGTNTHKTMHVRALHVNVTFEEPAEMGGTVRTRYVPIDFSDDSLKDAAATTAGWDTSWRDLRQPVIADGWVRNVSGDVRDLTTGFDVTADGRSDVWIGTGGVLSGNSPDYNLYAGTNEEKWLYNDNRVYLLDGSNGTILKRTAEMPGNVTHLVLSDADGDLVPEQLFAAVWKPGDGGSGTSYTYSLDPKTLAVLWSHELDLERPVDLEAGVFHSGAGGALAATQPLSEVGATGSLVSRLRASEGTDGDLVWSAVPNDRGRYLVTADVPRDWLFGPYVVEVVVEWTDQVTVVTAGVPVTQEVAQSARFYDYFVVTPPDSLNPPSAVYNVHLVAWLPEWG